ncbi:MAG: hypothetical protein H0W34_07860 [Pyrinomonadaceae bacterium]|nr:hypothetical protein [Pyrinomonadaceae bacterium]
MRCRDHLHLCRADETAGDKLQKGENSFHGLVRLLLARARKLRDVAGEQTLDARLGQPQSDQPGFEV